MASFQPHRRHDFQRAAAALTQLQLQVSRGFDTTGETLLAQFATASHAACDASGRAAGSE